MCILDTCYRNGQVHIWEKTGDRVRHRSREWDRSFLLDLDHEDRYGNLTEDLAGKFKVEECRYKTLHGEGTGIRIHAGRSVAEAIEQQAPGDARLFNVDLRADQEFLARSGMAPCLTPGDTRFSLTVPEDLSLMEVTVRGNPWTCRSPADAQIHIDGTALAQVSERDLMQKLARVIDSSDPDIVLFPRSDLWLPRLAACAVSFGLDPPFTRTGKFRRMHPMSYTSYGKTEYREGSLIPDGRVLIDTYQSFNYREGGLPGVLLASRLTGLSPNLSARLTAGTLISAYEVYEAVRMGIAVPYRKTDPEQTRPACELKSADRGGMILQPDPDIRTGVTQIDFTSLYPSIIVRYNLSPDTLEFPERLGFLPRVLAPLLSIRLETKRKKSQSQEIAGMDALLKWMLVTCFGYTGYRNAKFGSIEVHEAITRQAREILLKTKHIAEKEGFSVLHGMVDGIFVQGRHTEGLVRDISYETGLPLEAEPYTWIVFLPMSNGKGAYNRYYGKVAGRGIKRRGVMERRRDTPECVRAMQKACFDILEKVQDPGELASCHDAVLSEYTRARSDIAHADPSSLVIHRQVGTTTHTRRTAESAAVAACREAGLRIEPGMEIAYIVTDARRGSVTLAQDTAAFDTSYYQGRIDRAWEEIVFVFGKPGKPGVR